MLCTAGTTAASAMNPREGLYAILHGGAAANASVAAHRSCGQESTVTFSWSDFPVLGHGASSSHGTGASETVLEMEDLWIAEKDTSSCGTDSTCSTSSDEMSWLSRHSSVSVDASFVQEEATGQDTRRGKKLKVSFSNVLSIRTYDITLGDHPCCVGGMALTCDWTYDQDECIDLDVYERYAPKRPMRDLRLSYHERRGRLQAALDLSSPQLLKLEYDLVCAEEMATPIRLLPATRSHSASVRDLTSCHV